MFMKKNQKQEVVNEVIYPRLLSNHACGLDLFEGRSHELIARRIAQTITEDNSVHAIGLDGDWGSGKSNVIEQVRKFSKPQRDLIFVYDAWAYQADPQKRSILENIIEYLSKQTLNGENVFKGEEWDNKKKNLFAKRVETDVVETPRFGFGVIIAVLLIILTPMFEYVADLITNTFWKGVFLSVPVLSLLLVATVYRVKNRGEEGYDFKKAMGDAFSVYSGKKNESTSLETISETEPSSTQFKEWMKEIDAKLDGYKLVLVFDNLDRLTIEKVRELWSVINALFAEQDYKNIVVIVPFDRKHIQFAFQSEDMNRDDEIYKHSYGDDFINKTFNVVYRVSPPIMTAWKGFFEDKWKEAFGASCESKVLQIFETLMDKITPRKIIAYINRFVSIRQVMNKDIPDEYIALYILGEDSIKENPYTKIINPDYFGAMTFMYQQDENLPKFMAALYFQVAPEKAIEVVYTDRLRKALDENSQGTIKEIAQLSTFKKLLEDAIIGVINVPNAVEALNALGDEMVDRTIWDELYAKLDKEEVTLQAYQKILLRHITQKQQYLDKIIAEFYKAEKFNAVNFYESIKELRAQGLDVTPYLHDKVIPANEFVQYVQTAKSDYGYGRMKCSKGSLDALLAEYTVGDLDGMTVVAYTKENSNSLPKYRAHLEELIKANQTDLESVTICYRRLKELERLVKVKIADLSIAVLFQDATKEHEFYYDIICMRLARLGEFAPAQASVFAKIINQTDEETVEKVSQVIEDYMTYGQILLALPGFAAAYPLLKAVAQRLTLKPRGSVMNIQNVLVKYEAIKEALGLDREQLLNRLNGWQEFVDCDSKNIQLIPYGFYEDSLTVKNTLTKKIADAYVDYLNSLSPEIWKDKIINEDKEYRVLVLYRSKVRTAFEAFKSLLIDHAKGEGVLDPEKVQILVEWSIHHKCGIISAFKDMRDCFLGSEATMTPALFRQYAEYLFIYGRMSDKSDSLRKIFIEQIWDDDDCMEIILRHQEEMLRIMEYAGEDAQNVKDKLSSLWETKYNKNASEEFELFMQKLGLKREEKSDEDGEEIK